MNCFVHNIESSSPTNIRSMHSYVYDRYTTPPPPPPSTNVLPKKERSGTNTRDTKPLTKNYGISPHMKAIPEKTLTYRPPEHAKNYRTQHHRPEVEHNGLYKTGNIYTTRSKNTGAPKKGDRMTLETNCSPATQKHTSTKRTKGFSGMLSHHHIESSISHVKRLIRIVHSTSHPGNPADATNPSLPCNGLPAGHQEMAPRTGLPPTGYGSSPNANRMTSDDI